MVNAFQPCFSLPTAHKRTWLVFASHWQSPAARARVETGECADEAYLAQLEYRELELVPPCGPWQALPSVRCAGASRFRFRIEIEKKDLRCLCVSAPRAVASESWGKRYSCTRPETEAHSAAVVAQTRSPQRKLAGPFIFPAETTSATRTNSVSMHRSPLFV